MNGNHQTISYKHETATLLVTRICCEFHVDIFQDFRSAKETSVITRKQQNTGKINESDRI